MTGSSSTSDDRARRIVGWAVLVGGLLGALLSLVLANWEQRALFDRWQRAAPREISGQSVAVVLIDPISLRLYGSWPWPRTLLAELTSKIAAQKPKVIGFDMFFTETDAFAPAKVRALYPELAPAAAQQLLALPDLDDAFANAIGDAPVVLARLGVTSDGSDPRQLFVDPEIAGVPPRGVLRYPQVISNLPKLDDVALAHGLINGEPDPDGIVRRVPLTLSVGGRAMPGMAAELARIATQTPQLAWRGGRLAFRGGAVPADRQGRMQFRMGKLPAASVVLASEVLNGDETARGAFAGKVVLIGMGGDGTADLVSTPLGNRVSGAFVQVQAVDAILSGGWLARPGWIVWGEWAAAILLVLMATLAGGMRRYWLLPLGAAIVGALWLGSFLAFDRANLLLDPVRPTLVGLSAAIAMGVTLYLIARADRARLAVALTEQRVAAAEQEGELRAARRIQLGMVPGAEKLERLDPRVEIGAVLRPAKSVGGDFYDALMLGPDRLLFVIGDVTGKGVPAALYMALSKALSKSVLSRSSGDLGAAVASLNRELMAEADDEMGVTMLIGTLDCASGELALVNAGHENPLVVRKGDGVETLSLRGGPPFCVVDFPYPEERARLAPGETLVLITDGATEAQDAEQALLGLDGVIAAMTGDGDVPAAARASDLADRIRAFEGDTEPSDDLTIVALRYRGP